MMNNIIKLNVNLNGEDFGHTDSEPTQALFMNRLQRETYKTIYCYRSKTRER